MDGQMDSDVLGPLLSSSNCELRDLSKIVAKTFQDLRNKEALILNEKPLSCEFLEDFGHRVCQFSSGQVFELWKTLLYHLETDGLKQQESNNAKNVFILQDQLFSTFLTHICVAEQALPQRIVDKVIEHMNATQKLLSSLQGKLSMVQSALNDLKLLMKNCRNVDFSDLRESITKLDGNNILKRKLQSLDSNCDDVESKKSRIKLSSRDLIPDELDLLPVILNELPEEDILVIGDFFLRHEEHFGKFKEFVSENRTIQVSLLLSALKIQKSEVKSNKFWRKFIDSILVESCEWLKVTANESKVSQCAQILKLSLADNSLREIKPSGYLIRVLRQLPLECLKGTFEALIGLILVALIFAETSEIVDLLSRYLDSTYRTPSLLKYLEFTSIAPRLISLSTDRYDRIEIPLQCLTKVALTYMLPLETLKNNIKLFKDPLLKLDQHGGFLMSTILLENVSSSLTLKAVSDDKIKIYRKLFDKLSSAFDKGLKMSSTLTTEMKYLCVRMLNAILSVVSDDKEASMWSCYANEYIDFCLLSLQDSVNGPEVSTCCKFVHLTWDTQLGVLERLWSILLQSEDHTTRILDSAEGHELVSKMFKTSNDKTLDALMDKTCRVIQDGGNVSHLLNCWTLFVNLHLDLEDSLMKHRQQILLQLLQQLHSQLPIYSGEFIENFMLPCLTFEAAILECDKPILYREIEATLLMNSSTYELSRLLDVTDASQFCEVWKAIYRMISAAFHKRSSSLVVPRIPLVLAVLRNLLRGLAKISDQKRKPNPMELKELILLSHYFDRLCDHMKRLSDDFARVAPYFIADIVDSFQRVTVVTAVKSNLLLGVYKLLDICDKHSVEMLSGILPTGRKEIFKHTVAEYRKYFKYTGKI